MTKFKSNRRDGRGHKPPLSQKEKSLLFALKIPETLCNELKTIDRDKIRAVLKRLVKREVGK